MNPPLRYRLVRTPLEQPALWVREQLGVVRRKRNRFAAQVHNEDKLMGEVLDRVLTPTSNCLDIGAHYGSMLSAILRHAPEGEHWAVEAIPEKAAFLRDKFPDVRIVEHALSDTAGTVEFHINESQSGCSGLGQHGDEGDQFTRIEVEMRTLDEIAADAPDFDLVKIDVEGAEELVVKGGRQLLERTRPIVLFEASPSGMAALGNEPRNLFDAFTEQGMAVYHLGDWLGGGRPLDVDEFAAALEFPFDAFNYLAAP